MDATARPTITLTMIVKDEQERLPGALASAAGAVDEIIIVDTGSTDRTRRIAEEAGCVVIDHPFVDFADARNAALPHVSGQWMLVLDADERLAPGAAAVLRQAVAAGGFDCGLIAYHNAATVSASAEDVLSGAARRGEPVQIARLFRCTADFRWQGAAHETPRDWLADPARRFADIPTAIVHYGSAAGVVEGRGKSARNLGLLRARVEADPADLFGRVYLARELIRAERVAEAAPHLDAAWDVVSADPSKRAEIVTLVTLRAWLQIQQGAPQEAIKTLAAGAGWGAMHPNLLLLQGTALEHLAARLPPPHQATALDKAIEALALCPTFAGRRFVEEVIPGATGYAAATRQGACCLTLGRLAEAEACFAAALAEQPELEEARLGLAECLVERDPARALELAEGGGLDGVMLRAAAHEAQGDDRRMAAELVSGMELVRQGFAAPHRRALMDELVSYLGILQGQPRPGRGAMGALAGLMAGYPPPAGEQHPAPAGSPTARRLTKVIAYLQARGEDAVLAALAEPPGERLFPGIGALLSGAG